MAVFASDDHLHLDGSSIGAEASDTNVVCAPVLNPEHPSRPTGPIYIDHIIFGGVRES